MSSKEESLKISHFIQEKSEPVLIELVFDCLKRQPTFTEMALAKVCFGLGAACTASAMIDGIEQHDIIKRN